MGTVVAACFSGKGLVVAAGVIGFGTLTGAGAAMAALVSITTGAGVLDITGFCGRLVIAPVGLEGTVGTTTDGSVWTDDSSGW